MKNLMNKSFLFVISIIALLSFSCSNINSGINNAGQEENVDFGEGYGAIHISLGDDSRTACPLINNYDEWTWILKGTTKNLTDTDPNWVTIKTWKAGTSGIQTKLNSEPVGVRYGRWHFVLAAEKIVTVDDGNGGTENKTVTRYSAIGRDDTSGESDKTIIVIENAEASVTVNFHLVLTEIDTQVQGKGNLDIAVEYTSSAVKRIEGALFQVPSAGGDLVLVTEEDGGTPKYSFTVLTGNKYSLSDVPAGKYVAGFNFYDSLTGGNKLNANPYEEYVYIVNGQTSESIVTVQSLDDVYSVSYVPAPSVSAKGSYTRHSESFALPAAQKSDGSNELDSASKLFCGWYDNPEFNGTPVTQIPSGSRGNRTFYGKYVNAAEAEDLPDLTLAYLDNGIAEDDTEKKNKPQVGNTIILGTPVNSSCTYQWYSVDGETESNINGAATSSYKLTSDKIGKKIGLKLSKLYTVGSQKSQTNENQVLYHTVATGTENKSALLQSSGADAFVAAGTLDLEGINIQYGGKVIAGNKPNKSSLVLSGILKDIYGNSISNSLLKGDFDDYSALSASKNLAVTISVDGYTIASGTDTSVYITVQNAAPAGAGLKDSTGLDSGKVAFNDATVAMTGLQYSVDNGSTWKVVNSDAFNPPENNSIRLRYKETGTSGQEGYIMASDYVTLTVLAKNIGGNSVPAEDHVVLKTGSELNALFVDKFKLARKFVYTTNSPSGTSYTISDPSSTVEIKAWKTGTSSTTTINVSAIGHSGPVLLNEDSSEMFKGLAHLKTIDLSNFTTKNGDTAVVTNMNSMFSDCSALEEINFGNNFDTSAVTDMSGMFSGTRNLEEIDLSAFDTSSVTDMSNMFYESGLIELDLSKFDTSALTNASNMFAECISLESLEFGEKFKTDNVTDMSGMFLNVASVVELDLSGFETGKVTTMASMFEGAESLESLDLTGFTTETVTKMASMFNSCASLAKIYVGGWETTALTDHGEDMFYDCTNLVGGNGTVYTNANTDASYAKIDADGTPGYLTKFGE